MSIFRRGGVLQLLSCWLRLLVEKKSHMIREIQVAPQQFSEKIYHWKTIPRWESKTVSRSCSAPSTVFNLWLDHAACALPWDTVDGRNPAKPVVIWSFCPSFIGFSQSQLQDKTTIHNSLASGVDCWWSFSLKKKTDEKKGSIPKDLDPNNKLQHIWNKNTNKFPKWMSNVYTPWDKKQLKTTYKKTPQGSSSTHHFSGTMNGEIFQAKKHFRPQRPEPFGSCFNQHGNGKITGKMP